MARVVQLWKRQGQSIGFVPTMGALHAGHLSLIQKARRENQRVVVSIFVNPTQFGPKEDFRKYPRPWQRDQKLCQKALVHALYRPHAKHMYPQGFLTFVEVSRLSNKLCGQFRPGHFRGVATIVLKLLEQVRPQRAYFGEKDFQQLVIIRCMVQDLNLPVTVIGCPTVREADGLALSSRNVYLNPQQRSKAVHLYRGLKAGALVARKHGSKVTHVLSQMHKEVRKIPGVRMDYLKVVNPKTLEDAKHLQGPLRLVGAIRIGKTRLIDNVAIFC
jgi:pantoate--beta-alanine ligase